jgi:L-2-hydroxyglutarate oxidase LhgO
MNAAADAGTREWDVVVVGAGVVGLAVAGALAPARRVLVLERHEACARETSAHNSGVVHSGIYYARGSWKHRLCLAGNDMLFPWCAAHGVAARRTGKLVVAVARDELDALEAVRAQAEANGVPGVHMLDAGASRAIEPAVPALAALHSERTGIVDAAGLARALEAEARTRGAWFAYRHELCGGSRVAGGFALAARDADGTLTELRAGAVVNCAGHGAPAVAAALGYPLVGAPKVPVLRQRVNRGRYYDVVTAAVARLVRRPVYPVPRHDLGGLGVHLTPDLDGGLHLGPDATWLDVGAPLDYRADDAARAAFLASAQRLLPALRDEDIAPGQVGYRPKLGGPGDAPADFLIWDDAGYVHLGGIESPGLTACLPLAAEVAARLR